MNERIDVTGWREVTDHHDGHGLNDSTRVFADEDGPGGAPDRYVIVDHAGNQHVIQFQAGPRHEPGSKPGVLHEPLLAILMDRGRGFQERGAYGCRENALATTHTEEALLWHKRRADKRAQRGVLGRQKL